MSIFCAGGVRSIGSAFGFLEGRLWGRGRLLAPPTASVEPHRHTHINATTANMQRHTPAILMNQASSPTRLLRFLCSLVRVSFVCWGFCPVLSFRLSAIPSLPHSIPNTEKSKYTESSRQTMCKEDGLLGKILTGLLEEMRPYCSAAVRASELQGAASNSK